MLIYVNLITILTEYRRTYAKLKLLYEHFGQFQYSDQRDKGQIQTYVDEDGYYVKTKSKIKEYDSSLFRSIAVHILGEIEEKEYSSNSKFRRRRVIYMGGLCEEYSIHEETCFGIRKVVYPDGQLFTNEVYEYKGEWDEGWNAIGEETYAIQNKSIPYLLGDHSEIYRYRYVSEDGLLNIIDLRGNYNKEILSSSDSESSDNDSD